MTSSTPSVQIWQAAGSPRQAGDTVGQCRACGSSATGMLFEAWVKRRARRWRNY